MAKGYDRNQQRKEALSLFGKDLVRRSGSACELCESSGTKLAVFEVPPVKEEPEFDACIFLCQECFSQIENPRHMDPDHWRCLNNTVWNDIPAVQAMALSILKKLSDNHSWAASILEQVYPSEEVEEWVKKI